MIHLRAICPKNVKKSSNYFPFNLGLVKKINEINLHQPVTFFVGENGSGKSTLLEAIAAGVGSITVGGEDIQTDKSLDHARRLSNQLKFVWNQRTTRGFFLRAEDFFNFARRLNNMTKELEEQASEYEEKFSGYGLQLAKAAVLGQKAALVSKYGENLDANSHG
ncbi:MAG TPA: hypothetical protein DCZ55_10820, partial [Cyanobacteria bacterium UBA11371]|nr:hypothetical protein [Cyanobacteria bacterium UBA11371]